jgi:hypothetical protein
MRPWLRPIMAIAFGSAALLLARTMDPSVHEPPSVTMTLPEPKNIAMDAPAPGTEASAGEAYDSACDAGEDWACDEVRRRIEVGHGSVAEEQAQESLNQRLHWLSQSYIAYEQRCNQDGDAEGCALMAQAQKDIDALCDAGADCGRH